MKKIMIALLGIFIFVSFFELFHLTTEVKGWKTCAMVYDVSHKLIGTDFTTQLKITYKFFAFPIKTVWILVSQDGRYITTASGRGDRNCDGNWELQDLRF